MGEARRRKQLGLSPKHPTTIKVIWENWVNKCGKLIDLNNKHASRRSMAKMCQKCHNANPCHLLKKEKLNETNNDVSTSSKE